MSKVVAFDWSLFTACYFRSYYIIIFQSDYLNDRKKEEEEIKESIKRAITSQCQQKLIGYAEVLPYCCKEGDNVVKREISLRRQDCVAVLH
jgi:hypothetical protein